MDEKRTDEIKWSYRDKNSAICEVLSMAMVVGMGTGIVVVMVRTASVIREDDLTM